MATGEDQGFRAFFRHEQGEEYSMLLKGHSLEQAVSVCREESVAHRVAFLRVECWVRGREQPGVVLGPTAEADVWSA